MTLPHRHGTTCGSCASGGDESTIYMQEKLNINQQPAEDRPRERLIAHGAESLSKAELLAILIGSGNSRETAVELMQRVLGDCQESLTELSRMSIDALQAYRGMGPAKAVTVLAACELGRRRAVERASQQRMDSAQAIAGYFRPMLQDKSREECHVMFLRHNLTFAGSARVSEGGLTASSVDVRQVLRETLLRQCTAIAFCHNHPSGSLTPSRQDSELTRRLLTACQAVDITLVDHVIVSTQGYYSFHDEGKLL